MKILKRILIIGLITIIGLVPLVSKSQTGSLEVCVHCINGDVVEGAIITVGVIYSATTGADGCVIFEELLVGEWEVQCVIEGYPTNSTIVYIEEDILTECNFEIYCPQFVVEPLEVEVLLEPNEQSNEIITLSNPGLADVEWTAELEIFPPGNLNWISIDTTSGILTAGETTEVFLYFDAQGVLPWDYHAEIQFYTLPDIGTPKVDIVMNIEGQPGLGYLESEINCTNNILNWETFPPGIPTDSFHVYRDSLWYATVFATTFIDSLVFPEIEYSYFVTGYFFLGWESSPTEIEYVSVPTPENLEPANLNYTINGNMATINWNTPTACVSPYGYNFYIDGALLAFTTDTSYQLGIVNNTEVHVEALYYFGGIVSSIEIVITENSNNRSEGIEIYPNPAKDLLFVSSNEFINAIEIFNIFGKLVYEEIDLESKTRINISSLVKGIYFIKLDTDQRLITRKILIE